VTTAGEAPACQLITGDFHGSPTVGLAGGSVWFEALADAGPRVVRVAMTGEPNLLAETPDVAWPTRDGPYRLYGGHRLWLAPESAGLQSTPDGDGLTVEQFEGGLRLVGPPDANCGCQRSIEIRPDPASAVLHIRHEVRNTGPRTIEAALWAITQLPPGGRAVLPQPAAAPGHGTRPNRLLALWPYSSFEDDRLAMRDGFVAVHGVPGPGDLKVGCAVDAGWVAWARDGVALVRRWSAEPGLAYADLGCNAEVFATDRYTELEVLGPLVTLGAGDRAILSETWELRRVGTDDPSSLCDILATPIETRPAPALAPQQEA
jgi:hypothetical protein